MPSRSGSKTSGKSGHKHGGNSTTDQFGIGAIVVRVILAILTVILIILLIVDLVKCLSKQYDCGIVFWLIDLICILILCYGLWGIFAEAFWTIITLALNTFIWAILIFVLKRDVVEGLLALFICFVACVYAYIICKSGIDNNPLGCCCCC